MESAEDRLIARYFRPLATAPGAFGLSDDAAALTPPPGCDLVLTTDGVIAGVHFFPDDPPDTIGRKALRMNLSDLAAKGAKPAGFLLSLALPAGTDATWIAGFAAGLGEDAAAYGCPLFGGDTDHTPGPLAVSIAAFGTVPQGRMVRRSTAKAGDSIVVTGTIGDAALGVKVRRDPNLAQGWRLAQAMVALSQNAGPWLFLLLSILILIVMGSILEGAAALIIFGPLLLPVAAQIGINGLHFGVVLVIAMGIGLFAPPLGLGLYGACLIGGVPIEATVRPMLGYLGLLLLCLLVIAFVPGLTLWLPHRLGYQ